MDPSTKARIETLVASSPIFVFMKGSKLMPQCGFSNNVVQILHSLGVAFETFDVLSDPEIRQGIKEFSSWPTIPQVYVKGEFIGGSDILITDTTYTDVEYPSKMGWGHSCVDRVVDLADRADDDDRRFDSGGAQRLDDAETVEFGQHAVEDYGVVVAARGHEQSLPAVGGAIDEIARFRQTLGHEVGRLRIVLNHEYAHASTP